MKITCESCSAQYDLDDNRIPPSGLNMKCPACLHSFVVKKDGSAGPPHAAPLPPPKSKGITLSEISAITAEDAELPAPVGVDDEPGLPAPRAVQEVVDLPAPRLVKPVPVTKKPVAAPKPAPSKPPSLQPPPKPPITPPPKVTPPPSRFAAAADDLPAPVSRNEMADLPAPKKSSFAQASWSHDAPDLLAPKGPSAPVGIGLDAPEADDLLEPVAPRPSRVGQGASPPPVDLEHMDVVAPKEMTTDLQPAITDLQPANTDLEPKPEVMEVTPTTMDMTPAAKQPQPPDAPNSADFKPLAEAPKFISDEDPRSQRLSRSVLYGGGAALLLVGALGVSLGLFTSSGFFGVNLITGRHVEGEARVAAVRKLLAEDTLASYRRAASELHALVETDPGDAAMAGLEGQARLCAGRLGISAEIKNADKLLAPFDANEKAGTLPDVQKARALKALVAGKPAEARSKLAAVLQAAPSDASALVYLGWTEAASGDWPAADHAFAKAASAEANRAAALYGLGVARERQGDRAAAKDAYEKTLKRSAAHFGAQVALARLGEVKDVAPEERVQDLIEKRASSVGPKEVADAWTALGVMAADAGRREEAQDRLQRALNLDGDSVTARVAMARVQCDLGRAADAVASLRKLVPAQPKNLEARLGLVRALLEGKPDNYATEAATVLAPAAKDAPKDARVLYWQGRLAMSGEKPDRDAALAKLKAAVETDPKLLQAYLYESQVLSLLGRSDDAVDVLKQAAARSADDAQLLTELGAAYLSLGKASEAEAQLRAALEKRPEMYDARMYLGLALEAQGKLDEAGAAYDAVAQKSPRYPGLLERQGRLALKRGNRELASKLFSQALGDGVPTKGLRLAAAELALDVGKNDDAQHLAELVIREDDRSAAAHLLLARAHLAKGKPEEALPEARRAATLSDAPEAHLVLGRALEAMSKLDQAVTEYQLARRGSAEAEATLGRARIMVRLGATKDALSELQGLVRDNRLRAPALVLMGDCYTDLQQAEKARRAYEDAVKYGPNLADAAFKFGRALHDAGKRKPAIDMLARAIKTGGDQMPFSAEAYLLLGDSYRENHEKEAAVKAYKRFLELAPPDSPSRPEVQKHVSILGGG